MDPACLLVTPTSNIFLVSREQTWLGQRARAAKSMSGHRRSRKQRRNQVWKRKVVLAIRSQLQLHDPNVPCRHVAGSVVPPIATQSLPARERRSSLSEGSKTTRRCLLATQTVSETSTDSAASPSSTYRARRSPLATVGVSSPSSRFSLWQTKSTSQQVSARSGSR